MSPTLLLVLMISMIVTLLTMIMSSMRMRVTQIDTLPSRRAHRSFVRWWNRGAIPSIVRSLDNVRSELSWVNKQLVLRSFSFC